MSHSDVLPNGDVCICFMTPDTNGRIASRGCQRLHMPVIQYACACDVTKGLPFASDPNPHALSVDTGIVNCPHCQETEVFQARYLEQYGHAFPSATTTEPPPVPTTTTEPPTPPAE